MPYILDGKTGKWEIVVGLEIHCQMNTKSKLFSRSANEFGSEPNNNVSFVDAAMPGQLPTLNEEAIKLAVKTGLGFKGNVQLRSVFDRKNYFYADLPQGYQISQFYYPIILGGYIDIKNEDGEAKRINMERLHIEQDAGKLMHDKLPNASLVDLNRVGIPLMEMVSKPDISSPFEAMEFLKQMRSLVRALNTSDGNMEEGSMRCDANVSVRRVGVKTLGTRCEIKNVNSFRNVGDAIEYEAKRQIELLGNGDEVEQETRLYNADTGVTKTMRSKGDAIDYRYFPDPDLSPLILTEEYVEEIRRSMPELPEEKKVRYMNELGLSEYDAITLTVNTETTYFFESLLKNNDAKIAVNWLVNELFGRLNKAGIELKDSPVSPEKLDGLLNLIKSNVISGKIAKEVLDIMIETGKEASIIVDERGLKQITDESEIGKMVEGIIANNLKQYEQYKAGNDKLFAFFIGQLMKVSGGRVNPEIANKVLKQKLN